MKELKIKNEILMARNLWCVTRSGRFRHMYCDTDGHGYIYILAGRLEQYRIYTLWRDSL